MKRNLTILLVIVMLMIALNGCSANEEIPVQAEQEKAVAVEVVKPREGNISQSITLSGRLEPKSSVTVIPEIQGLAKVKDLRVKLGDLVNEGDILFTLDRENTEDQIENIRLSYETALKNYEKAKESYENAQINLARMEQLYSEGAISQQQLEQAQLAASSIQMEALESQLDQARFSYENSLKQLEKSVVKAPISGYISLINIEENGMASPQPSLIITDISELEVEILIAEGMINKIKSGQEIEMEIPAVGSEIIKGTVQTLNPVPDPVTQLYKGKIALKNSDQIYRPGMFAKIYVNTDEKNDVLIINSIAVIEEENQKFVYTVEKDSAVRKEVEIGMDNGEIVEILGGLSKEDRVVVKGQDFIKDGSKVKVVRGEE
jgi:RND family efflux transporter MFP subunit